MESIILKKNKDIYKIITAVLIALFPIHPVFTLYFDWPVILKCVLILICLGFRKYYVFEFKKQLVQVRFLGFKLNENSIFEHSANYLLIHKAVQDTKYELRIGTDKEYEIIVIHKDYFYVSNLASQLSHLLHIDLYNPFEDYD